MMLWAFIHNFKSIAGLMFLLRAFLNSDRNWYDENVTSAHSSIARWNVQNWTKKQTFRFAKIEIQHLLKLFLTPYEHLRLLLHFGMRSNILLHEILNIYNYSPGQVEKCVAADIPSGACSAIITLRWDMKPVPAIKYVSSNTSLLII